MSRRTDEKGAVSKDVPTHEELRRILSHLDEKGKALVLLLASSGMRVAEALLLRN